MALDSNDRVHISYHSSVTDKSLRYLAVEPSSIVYAYSISPALPAGLSLEISTGEISGTPTELSTNTTYTITVRNSGGVDTTTITIEVNDEVPTIAYSPNDLTITNNTASSDLPLSPTITGSGDNHVVGNQRHFTCRSDLRDQQRYDLGNTDRTVDANGLHGLGQQQRWVRRRLPQHHRS